MRSGGDSPDSPRSQRFSLPSAMAQVTVRLELSKAEAAEPMVGRLWDISTKGACLAIPGAIQLSVPQAGQLHLHDPMTHERLSLDVEARWTTPLSHTTFVGVKFVGDTSPSQTFLSCYMKRTWTDRVPHSNLEL